ncbi:MAG: glucokinase [Desulfatiglandales bacterium]|jgi:glucokinase|nr:glucokinase [Desulfatiglandales bacterium]
MRIVSGLGLFNIYVWLRGSKGSREPEWVSRNIKGEDPAKVIAETALAQAEPLCEEALDIFVSILGAVAGNLALTGFTTGEFYLGGGISPKILPKLEDGSFMEAFTNKGRFQNRMTKIPFRVILNDRATLIDAADFAFKKNIGPSLRFFYRNHSAPFRQNEQE